jgi:hypothetical protein
MGVHSCDDLPWLPIGAQQRLLYDNLQPMLLHPYAFGGMSNSRLLACSCGFSAIYTQEEHLTPAQSVISAQANKLIFFVWMRNTFVSSQASAGPNGHGFQRFVAGTAPEHTVRGDVSSHVVTWHYRSYRVCESHGSDVKAWVSVQ